MKRSFGLWALLAANIAVLLMIGRTYRVDNAEAYTGAGGIWIVPKGQYVATPESGDQSGLNAGDALMTTSGYGQIGPGLEGLAMPAYRPGVAWFRQRYDRYQIWGVPFESAHRGVVTFRADSAGVWINGNATGANPRGLFIAGANGRWNFRSDGQSLADSTTSGTPAAIWNQTATSGLQLGGGGRTNDIVMSATGGITTNRDLTMAGTFAKKICPATMPSAATLDLPTIGTGNIYTVTGIITTTHINAMPAGTELALLTSNPWMVQSGGNLELKGDFVGSGTRREMLKLICDGTNWIEESRTMPPSAFPGDITIGGSVFAHGTLSGDSLIATTIFRALQCGVFNGKVITNDTLRTTKAFVVGGEPMTRIRAGTFTLDVTSISANSTLDMTTTINGLNVASNWAVIVSPNSAAMAAGVGIDGARVSADNTLQIRFRNGTGGSIDPVSQTFSYIAFRQ